MPPRHSREFPIRTIARFAFPCAAVGTVPSCSALGVGTTTTVKVRSTRTRRTALRATTGPRRTRTAQHSRNYHDNFPIYIDADGFGTFFDRNLDPYACTVTPAARSFPLTATNQWPGSIYEVDKHVVARWSGFRERIALRRPIKLSSRTCRTERSLEKKWKRPGMRSAWKRERAASQFHFREGKRLRRTNTTRSLFIPARKNHNFRNIRDTVSRASWCRVRRISLCAPVSAGSNSSLTN